MTGFTVDLTSFTSQQLVAALHALVARGMLPTEIDLMIEAEIKQLAAPTT